MNLSSYLNSSRIKYYKFISSYINQQKKDDPNNCLTYVNSNYYIGNNIILDKKIGSKSAYGVVFLSHFKTANKKKIIFASKIIDASKKYNIIEARILTYLTKLNTYRYICPHFPFTYGILKCNYNKFDPNIKYLLQKLYNKPKLLFIFSELANDNLHNLMKNPQITPNILYNALTQIFISIMFFNKYLQAFHSDGHSGNFLYHKIKPGGYFHYKLNNQDYYVENLGYLWVIWDFGQVISFKEQSFPSSEDFIYKKKLSIDFDYSKILSSFIKYNNRTNKMPNLNIIQDNIYKFTYDINKMPILINIIIKLLLKYTNNSLLDTLPISNSSTTKKYKILNKKPFIL